MPVLYAAVLVHVLAGTLAIAGIVFRRWPDRTVLALLVLALALHGLAIALRWNRLGHGPFITMFEILLSNVWSLTFGFTIVYVWIKPIRPAAAVVVPVIFVMLAWLLASNPGEGFFPPTYDTILLYIHVFFGKVFLASLFVALAPAGVVLLRRLGAGGGLVRMPDDESLDTLAYRFLALALIFDSLMLIAGAIWAQDAWGRYWDWDPLETWAFLTWLLLGFVLHARLTFRPSAHVAAAMVYVVFVLAFLTFFGVPFVSMAPHKGVI